MCLKAAPEDGQKARDSAFFQVWSAAALPLSGLHDLYLDHHSIYEDVRCCSLVNTDTISGCVVLVGRGSIGLLSNNAPVRAAVDKHWRVRASDFCPGKGAFRRTTSSPICLRTCRQRRRRTAAGPHSIASDNLFAHDTQAGRGRKFPSCFCFIPARPRMRRPSPPQVEGWFLTKQMTQKNLADMQKLVYFSKP